MENQKPSMFKSAMTYGLILALALIVMHLIQYMMDMYKTPLWVSILTYIVIIAGIIYGTIRFRDDELKGYISYGKALGSGVLISLFSSIVYGFYFYLLAGVIDPNYLENVFKTMEQAYFEAGMTYEQIDMAMAMVRKFQSPIIMMISSIFTFTFMGTIFSLITSIFIKKEEPLFDTN